MFNWLVVSAGVLTIAGLFLLVYVPIYGRLLRAFRPRSALRMSLGIWLMASGGVIILVMYDYPGIVVAGAIGGAVIAGGAGLLIAAMREGRLA